MEDVYRFSRNDLTNLRESYEEFKKELEIKNLPKTYQEIQNILNLNDEQFKELEEQIALDKNLGCEMIRIPNFDPSIPVARHKQRLTGLDFTNGCTKFKTFREFWKIIEAQKSGNTTMPFSKSQYNFKFVKQNFKPIQPTEKLIEPLSDIVISIRFYRPFRYNKGHTTFGPRFAEEFLVLGSQTLNELRAKINCISNNRCLFDISENPYQEAPKPKTNSGFFFITDTFYNDTSTPENYDYSKVIRDWYSGQPEYSDDKFNTASMEKTKFFDLNVRLGFPQVYQHQANCEHLFTFSSVHLITKSDHLRQSDYPILKTMSISNSTLCNMCGIREYLMVVKNSNKHVHDPAYLCRSCFEHYHYVDGKKVGSFQAYQLNPNDWFVDEENLEAEYEEEIHYIDINEYDDEKVDDDY